MAASTHAHSTATLEAYARPIRGPCRQQGAIVERYLQPHGRSCVVFADATTADLR
jgi:hypothetical protein